MELCNSQNRRTDCRGAAMGAAACWLRRRHDRPAKGIISNIVSRVFYAAGHPIAQNGAPITIGAHQFLVKVPSIFALSAIEVLYAYAFRWEEKIRGLLLLVAIVPHHNPG